MLARKLVAAGAIAGFALTACQSDAQQAPVSGTPGICREDAVETLAGKGRIDDAEARQITGATSVRQIRPGQGVTMDYRKKRVTIEIDPRAGRIIRVYCG